MPDIVSSKKLVRFGEFEVDLPAGVRVLTIMVSGKKLCDIAEESRKSSFR